MQHDACRVRYNGGMKQRSEFHEFLSDWNELHFEFAKELLGLRKKRSDVIREAQHEIERAEVERMRRRIEGRV